MDEKTIDDEKTLALIWCFLNATPDASTRDQYMELIEKKVGKDCVMKAWNEYFVDPDDMLAKVLGLEFERYYGRLYIDGERV